MDLTKSELEVMNVLWQAGRPLTKSEILAMSENKTWRDSYIHIMLNSLLEKKAIAEAGRVRTGKTFGRLFSPKISCEEYYAKNVFAGKKERLPMLFSALVRCEGISPELIDQLELMLKERRKELEAE